MDVIVTEYCAASLRGRSLAQRARAMISIAAPPFRERLERAAWKVLKAGE
jgi:acyl-CoA hydrolase